jgi:hypothetical protein
MKQKILIIPLILILAIGNTQTQEYNNIAPEWLINSSGENWDVICDMVTGTDSSLFIAGNYSSSTQIKGKTILLSGEKNSFVIKLDQNGNQLWQTHLVSSGYTNIASLSSDGKGALFVAGTFVGKLNIGSFTLDSSIVKSLFILKLDKDGKVDMLEGFPGDFSNRDIAIANNKKNELLLTATFTGHLLIDDLDFTSNYYKDILLTKIGVNGKITNKTILHGELDDIVHDIACDGNDNIYITGSFERELSFDGKKIKTSDDSDAFLIKLNDESEVVYGKQIGGIYNDYGKTLAFDNNGNVLLTGSFTGELSLAEAYTLTSNGVLDVFVIKYDKNGNLVWADSFGGGANDYVSSMAISPKGNIYIDGTYRGSIEKDDSQIESSGFSNDIFLAKYNSTGKFQYLETAGDTNVDFGRKLLSDGKGYIYLSGDFNKSLKLLDKESKEAPDNDFFVARLYDCEESPKVQLPADTNLCGNELKLIADPEFDKYFWDQQPGNNEHPVDTSGAYIVKALDEHGCVSRDTILVNLHPIPLFDLGDTIFAQKGEFISIDAPPGMEDYLWSDGSSLSCLNINTMSFEAGVYDYSLMLNDENECLATDDIALIVLDNSTKSNNLVFKNYSEEVLNTNVKNSIEDVTVKVYPNPAKDILFIEIVDKNKTLNEVSIELNNMIGRICFKKTFNIDDLLHKQINISDLAPGIYTLTIYKKYIFYKRQITIY